MSDRRGKERKQGSRAKVMRLHAAGDFDRVTCDGTLGVFEGGKTRMRK